MESTQALAALSALAHPLRLAAFRRLVVAGRDGIAAGELARALGAPPSTLSAALGLLAGAGIARGERAGRSIRYSADMDGVRGLLAFLMEDCCGGDPALCRPALADLALACGCNAPVAA